MLIQRNALLSGIRKERPYMAAVMDVLIALDKAIPEPLRMDGQMGVTLDDFLAASERFEQI